MSVPSSPPPVLDAPETAVPPLPVLGHLPSRWEPSSDGSVTTHSGFPLPPNRLYLAGAPKSIGQVLSASSSMDGTKGAEAQTMKRIGSSVLGFIIGAVVV